MKQVMNYNKDNGLLNMIRRTDPMINGTSTMSNVIINRNKDISGQVSIIPSYPRVSKKIGTIIIQRHDSPKVNGADVRLWKKK